MRITRRAASRDLGKISLIGVLLAAACEGNQVEGPNGGIFLPLGSSWTHEALEGEFSNPQYPVSIPSSRTNVNFTAEVRGWRNENNPWGNYEPTSVSVYFYAPPGDFFLGSLLQGFLDDPTRPTKRRAVVTGGYYVAYFGDANPDKAIASVAHSNITESVGQALLPWKYDNANSSVIGVAGTTINSLVWVQAVSTSLPQPHTYLWTIDGTTLEGVNDSYHDTTFATPGPRYYSIKITGSNGQFVTKTWTAYISCPGGEIYC